MLEKIIIIVFVLALFCFAPSYCSTKKIKVGDSAPDFSLIDETGNVHILSELRGHKVVLYFYPKDNTPGCTKEACNIRDNFEELKDLNIIIFGLSNGPPKSKQQFKKQYSLPFPLLTAKKSTLKDYGVQGGLFTLFMPKRKTFLIDEKGIIIDIINNVNVTDHTQQIIDGFMHQHQTNK